MEQSAVQACSWLPTWIITTFACFAPKTIWYECTTRKQCKTYQAVSSSVHLALFSLFVRPFSPSWVGSILIAIKCPNTCLVKVVSNDDGRDAESTMFYNLHHLPSAVDHLKLDKDMVILIFVVFIIESCFQIDVHLTSSRSLSIMPFLGSFFWAHFLPGHCNIRFSHYPPELTERGFPIIP